MLCKIVNKIKLSFPPDKNWKFQKQTNPPVFGWAEKVNEEILVKEVNKRRDHSSEVIRNVKRNRDVIEGKVAIVILSCRRWQTLHRLTLSLKHFFETVETYPLIERVLVDNGSGEELIENAKESQFFDRIIAHPQNLGMVGALREVYKTLDAEYILLLEDDFILDYDKPFLARCIRLFDEYPEIGIIRLKNQNNWWKPQRIIAPLRTTSDGTAFWTWLPSSDGMLNVWAAGSVLFRKASYLSVGELPEVEDNKTRDQQMHQGYIYECVYGKRYNEKWLAAKIKDGCPFAQPNNNDACEGWGR